MKNPNNRKEYHIGMEVWGPYAHFNRVDASGMCDRSYPAPTYNAVQCMFSNVMSWKEITIVPTKVEICNPLQYTSYKCNDGYTVEENTRYNSVILHDVRYKIHARLEGYKPEYNVKHAFQVRFNCRLKWHKKLRRPQMFLGRREFVANFSHLNPDTKACETINEPILGMFREWTWTDDVKSPVFFPELTIEKGVLTYDK